MKNLSRATALRIAAVLSFAVGAIGLVLMLPMLARGAAALDQAADAPPYVVVLAAFVFAILRMVGAYGAWQNQRWGVILTLLANALDALAAAPGLLFAPTPFLLAASAIGIVLSLVVIVLCFWRDPKPAVA